MGDSRLELHPIHAAQDLLKQAAELVAKAVDFGDVGGSQRIQIGHDLHGLVARLGRLHDRRTG